MQSLPVTPDLIASATTIANNANASSASERGIGDSFDTMFSSFIQPDRTDYTGRPDGFGAYKGDSNQGTLDEDKAEELRKALKQRNAQDASVQMLEQMMASGMPLTMGRVMGALSGRARASGSLKDDERSEFTSLMQKMGFTGDESDKLLAMSDKGQGSAVWKNINAKMDSGATVDMNSREFSALLKGLDISASAKGKMMEMFGQGGTINKEQLNALMADAGKELAARDLAAKAVQAQMRDAVKEAMQAARLKKNSDAVENNRGSSRSDRMERNMQNSSLKTAVENMSQDANAAQNGKNDATGGHNGKPRGGADDFGGQSGSDRTRAERILSTVADDKPAAAKSAPKSDDTALRQMLHRLDITPPSQLQNASGAQKADLAALAKNNRQEIFSQVEKGLLQNAQDGSRQLTLKLNPDDLGQLTLIMNVRQGEVRAVIRADKQETAEALQQQMESLKTTLEEQGIKVAELEVQTQLQQDTTAQQWNGSQEHNLMHDAQERARTLRLTQIRREAVADNQGSVLQNSLGTSDAGLHVVA